MSVLEFLVSAVIILAGAGVLMLILADLVLHRYFHRKKEFLDSYDNLQKTEED